MKIALKVIGSLLGALVLVSSASALAREPIEGVWKNRPNTLLVKIAPCGASLCGTVIGAAEDAKESVRKEGTGTLIGTRVLTELRKAPDGSYRGVVYNPNLNIHASGTVTLVSPTVLLVKGCVLAGLICRQQHWNRVT